MSIQNHYNMSKTNELLKLASLFQKKLAQRLEPLKPLQPNQRTPSYKEKLMLSLKEDVKAAIETINVDMATSTVKVKFKDGTMFKDKLIKSMAETMKYALPGWKLKEVGYLGY